MIQQQHEPVSFNAGRLGHIQGLDIKPGSESAVRFFGGLPYAQPPTGEWRFRGPRRLPQDHQYGTLAKPGQHTRGTWWCPQPPSSNTPDASIVSEDCLQLNIWVPAGRPPPEGGWPVCFYIHGGFLQVGTANLGPGALAPLLGDKESVFRAIMVLPAYRLNVFGFLASRELADEARAADGGNMGLWDQRAALEWTHDNITCFGGDPDNITVAGYSAGAYSALQQLGHELFRVPAHRAIIRRVAAFSNSPGLQPKTFRDQQEQFDELLTRLGISLELSAETKLAKLRSLPHQDLVEAQAGMRLSEFRVVADDRFYPADLVARINDGRFARQMKTRGVTLLSGECALEHTMYRRWRTPGESRAAVEQRLRAEYGQDAAAALMRYYHCAGDGDDDTQLPRGHASWGHFFGHLYAGIQVHQLQRGFVHKLFEGGLEPGRDVLRYRFERRLACTTEKIPAELGVTHLTDIPVWLWGADYREGLTDQEKRWLASWNQAFAAFVRGEAVAGWGPVRADEMRRWRSDGATDVWQDELWDDGVQFWHALNGKIYSRYDMARYLLR
ncbi:carboxylesterase [Microdochium bolleyi]|uniref:Carboxylic ester hydrolase n=1 Tax=Microdochium bolleyi TaxID=196109 RepID=A0A136IQH4_9PEZI|nr:carboxylesterase [Microdochium bolleyi]